MKNMKRLTALMLLGILSMGLWILPAAATTVEYDGLRITMTTDQEMYLPGEPITATLTVENTNSYPTTIVSLEQLIPEGYVLSAESKSALKNVTLGAKKTTTLEVTFEGDPDAPSTDPLVNILETIVNGKTFGIPNLLLVVLGTLAVIVFFLMT